MKKKYSLIIIASCFMFLVACQNATDSTPIPTNTVAPTEGPTEVPSTEEPTPTNVPEPTVEPTEILHEHTWIQKETSATCLTGSHIWEECECGEVQTEQFGTEFTHGELVYTITEEPTEETEGAYMETCILCGTVINQGTLPVLTHEHVWEKKEVEATCTEDGKAWEECKCGAMQNEVVIKEALGHGELTYYVVTEPSLTEEGFFENICNVCGALVSSGILEKLTPTPTPSPSPTPTPKPTNTPTPTPVHVHEYTKEEIIPKTCISDCYVYKVCECGDKILDFTLPKSDHMEVSYVEVKAPTLTEEGIYHIVCDLCKEVTEKGTIPMLTPTPTPKPTATPTPAISTIPVVEVPSTDFSNKEVVEVEQIDEHITRTTYTDGTKAKVYVGEDGKITPLYIEYPDGSSFVTREDGSLCYYDNEGNRWSLQEHNLDNDHIFYTRFYLLADYTKYHVLCNSDGSLNQWSDIIFKQNIMAFSDITGKSLALTDINYSTTELRFSFRETGIEIIEGRFVSSQKVTPISWEEFYEVILK